MIISPPFLSQPNIPVYSDQCVSDVMPGGIVGSGAFPVSQAMAWHGGIHINAPAADEPVRAIADGIVIFRRDGGTARYDAQDHSTGCVVIRHKTEIGANGANAVEVVYYSIYQHLRLLDANLPAVNQAVYRKDKLGLAGTIYGRANCIHLEIVAGDADTRNLVGRDTGNLPLTSDGRTDAVYGEVYVLVPAKSPYHSAQPTGATLPAAAGDSGGADLIVGIRYEAANATLTTYQLTGEVVGAAIVETDAEYNLYTEANTRHGRLSASVQTTSSPSGWYELLRFGRKLGTDPLPNDAAHWRKVAVPGQPGGVWLDLNASNTRKFSDADFPHWSGWKLIDDDTQDDNSQCSSALIDAMLAPAAQPTTPPSGPPNMNGPSVPTPQAPENATTTPEQKAANRKQNLCKPAVQAKLAKTVCKFPTEWAKDEVRKRWAWTRDKGNPHMPYPLEDETDFTEMSDFAQKLCFWEELPAEDKARLTIKHWHFHPREFIKHFRKCGWLGKEELAQLLPRRSYKYRFTPFRADPVNIGWATALQRFSIYSIEFNKAIRKYGISIGFRLAHFLGQIYIETDIVRTMREVGQGRKSSNGNWPAPAMEFYTVFFGRGMMQLTWPANYDGYRNFRTAASLPDSGGSYVDQWGRITTTSTHYWANPRDGGVQQLWFPRYDPDIIASDAHNSCDSAGWYWVSKAIGNRQTNINQVCDQGMTSAAIGRASVLVNGGGYGYFERQGYALFAIQYLSEASPRTDEVQIQISHGRMTASISVNYQPQRP
ncbi:peptidoglycan DD-metalloendopeptidase family protein [Variovorax paradoxus]|uniref:Peptidoglycan DD-metalloendopeptidase family protein n=1 Tax=Variovorax paradoxus TaxID=34073 RepID=A0A5Q0MB01_VARPD|nr:M23 family metallopeptidase [Variovorax paradoxus]QFZ85824.1 peptidoglycan DD-metalloendopeptidase family protein [Variovorax paradoxus]